jgi:hypothetical protein
VKFVPGGLKLFGGARMIEAVKPGILQKYVEAAYKRAGRCQLGVGGNFGVRGIHNSLLQAPIRARTHVATHLDDAPRLT